MRRFMVLTALTLVLAGVLLPAGAALPTYSCTATMAVTLAPSSATGMYPECAFDFFCPSSFCEYEARVDVNGTGLVQGFWETAQALNPAADVDFVDANGDDTNPPACQGVFTCQDPDNALFAPEKRMGVIGGPSVVRVRCRGADIALFMTVTCTAAQIF
jgi:hypothetical protein